MRFNGADYLPSRDDKRLSNQLERVFEFMSDNEWHTLREISVATDDPESSVSAQLRHLRKERFGSHVISREHIQNGLYKYKLEKKNVRDD